MPRAVLAGLLALLLVGSLAACGKKGDPAPPDPDQNTYPRTYPKSW